MFPIREENGTYRPIAIYYQEADFLEYVREDVPYIARRVDEFLTLILDMQDRRIIGVRIKGFRYLYRKSIKQEMKISDQDFFSLRDVFEKVMKEIGDDIFIQLERRRAYEQALEMADSDKVRVDSSQLAA